MSQQINLLLPELKPRFDWLALPVVAGAALAGLILVVLLSLFGASRAASLKTQEGETRNQLAAVQQQVQALGQSLAARQADTNLERQLAAARLADETLSEDDALDALEQVGLAGREDLACKYLSQGQKRRVALARLVTEKRPLWILDEPFVALDVAAVDWLAGIISGHLQRGGLAVMTTHQLVNIPAGTVRELRLG